MACRGAVLQDPMRTHRRTTLAGPPAPRHFEEGPRVGCGSFTPVPDAQVSMIMADFVFLSTSSKKGLVIASAKTHQSLHAFSEKLKVLDGVPNKNSWIKMIK